MWMFVAATNRVLLTVLLELKAEVRDLKSQMMTILETLQSTMGGADEELDDLPVQLPIQTHEDLLRLEEELHDRALQKILVRFSCAVLYMWL